MFRAGPALQPLQLVEMLGLADDCGAGVSRAEEVLCGDAKVWGIVVEKSRQLVMAATELCGVLAGPVRHCGARVADVARGHGDGAHSRAA